MKKHRKQSVRVLGKKQLVDVPVDGDLYKADNREEYQRTRAEAKHVPLIDVIADLTGNAVEAYEEKQLLACAFVKQKISHYYNLKTSHLITKKRLVLLF